MQRCRLRRRDTRHVNTCYLPFPDVAQSRARGNNKSVIPPPLPSPRPSSTKRVPVDSRSKFSTVVLSRRGVSSPSVISGENRGTKAKI